MYIVMYKENSGIYKYTELKTYNKIGLSLSAYASNSVSVSSSFSFDEG